MNTNYENEKTCPTPLVDGERCGVPVPRGARHCGDHDYNDVESVCSDCGGTGYVRWVTTEDGSYTVPSDEDTKGAVPCEECGVMAPVQEARQDVLCGCGWGRLACPESQLPVSCPLCGHQFVEEVAE